MSLNKKIFSALIASFLFAGTLTLSQNSMAAAGRCAALFGVEAPATTSSNFTINEILGSDKMRLRQNSVRNLRKAFTKAGLEFQEATLPKIIESAASQIKGRSRTGSIERSNRMAELGREIVKATRGDITTKAQKKMLTYMIAESVLRLESFRITDYKPDTANSVFKQPSVFHITDFHSLVKSYIDGTKKYTDLPAEGGVLDWLDIRNLYANNSWIIGIKDHDMYHLHYSYGHPYYLAVNMHSSRTINDRRYMMISALWESVDNFRTGYEESISSYIRGKGMSTEEGMLFLGSATEKELDSIDAEIGTARSEIYNYDQIAYGSGWRPLKTRFGRNTTNYNESTFLREMTDFINESLRLMQNPANKKYYNYHRNGPGSNSSRDENTIP